ncbi:MAG: DUF2520 domain-containing protein [Rhodothermales bacterium]|nr:DUF2520 domain-containing protein [Rhodothermales bacterium]MBO6778348.1 DUF2520 domain-containing protein [Rhodothermales bacterium]
MARKASTFTLVGAGAVASTFGLALLGQEWRPIGVFGRTPDSPRARALAEELGADAGISLDEACHASDLVLIAVPDVAIHLVAEELALGDADWSGRMVVHTSGAHPASFLAPLEQHGARTAAMHPLQSFPGPAQPGALRGAYVTLQGHAAVTAALRNTLEEIGALAIEVTESDKVAVHTAASMISNFTVTVAAMAREVLQTTGLGEQDVVAMLQPLLAGTVENIRLRGPERALTGPIVRGDIPTVERHVELLSRQAPHLITAYVALATETVRVARKTARLTSADAMEILDRVIEALPIPPASEED